MPPEEFRRLAHETADWMADYLAGIDALPVFPSISPGTILERLRSEPPDRGEPMAAVLEDFRDIVVPGLTHWNHPAFFGYFAITASGPGILGEMLTAALNVNAMVWRSAPAATELEDLTTDWVRRLLRLPDAYEGVINDTASSSTLYALAAARDVAYPESHARGLFGLPPGRVYASDQAHSSVEKAVLTLGLGRDGYRAVASGADLRMDPAALRAAMAEDRSRGIRTVAVVPTLGTTSTASLDPVADVTAVAEEFGAWIHVDAAYGGPIAVLPELAGHFAGWERADSIVVNPHKWLFTPIDCSILYCRRPEALVRAFSIVPEYLTSVEQSASRSLMDYGVSLGRRFRALKLWFVLRYFGREGIERRLRDHMRLARMFADWVDTADDWTLCAPVHLGAVAYRFSPGWPDLEREDDANRRILDRINASGEAFLTHTSVHGRTVLRLSVGNLRTTDDHLRRTWELLRRTAEAVHEEMR